MRNFQLPGIWIIESRYPESMIVSAIEFRKDQGGFSGSWSDSLTRDGALAELKVSEIRQEQDLVSFKTRIAEGLEWYWTPFWTGRFEDADRLNMDWVAPDGHIVRNRIFRRVTDSELAHIKTHAPRVFTEKLSLPKLRELPFDGLAMTPPMGWSSWSTFKESVDDRTVRETADAMVASGLRDAGYVYVNIDDGWQGERDAQGVLHPNSRFPDMKALADYVHGKGLKLGIYSSPGPMTCCGYVGSHGHEAQDAQTFARWGIDLIRYDWCSAALIYKTQAEMQAVYQKMGEALRAAGRPIVYTLCQYGFFDVSSWGRKVGGHMWRTGPDMVEGLRWAMMSERFETNGRPENQGPGGWNDPDHMVIGMDGMSEEEQRTHMTLWVIQGAPLILSHDVRVMTPAVARILLNPEVIAIDQDPLGKHGQRVLQEGTTEVWVKPLADRSSAVALFNRGDHDARLSLIWADLGIEGTPSVRDLWKQTDLGRLTSCRALIPAHGSVFMRVRA